MSEKVYEEGRSSSCDPTGLHSPPLAAIYMYSTHGKGANRLGRSVGLLTIQGEDRPSSGSSRALVHHSPEDGRQTERPDLPLVCVSSPAGRVTSTALTT